jgi:hypothetical protein
MGREKKRPVATHGHLTSVLYKSYLMFSLDDVEG